MAIAKGFGEALPECPVLFKLAVPVIIAQSGQFRQPEEESLHGLHLMVFLHLPAKLRIEIPAFPEMLSKFPELPEQFPGHQRGHHLYAFNASLGGNPETFVAHPAGKLFEIACNTFAVFTLRKPRLNDKPNPFAPPRGRIVYFLDKCLDNSGHTIGI